MFKFDTCRSIVMDSSIQPSEFMRSVVAADGAQVDKMGT